jgi:HlyD family secretion protein
LLRRLSLIVIAVLCATILYFLIARRATPPEVPFTRVTRETVVSTLNTNGKVEPIQWASARAETPGLVERIFVQRGQRVAAGALLVQLDTRQLQADLNAAQGRVEQAQAELQTLQQGGRSADIAAIDSALAAARQELAVAQRDYQSLQRLKAKGAATAAEVTAAQDRVQQTLLNIQGLEQKRAALVSQPDRSAAQGRLREAQAAASGAQARIDLTSIRAPISGIVYQLGEHNDLHQGSYLMAGDLVANIGNLDRVRVTVYVDEPDLGRVAVGMPVTITWDALPGREWKGSVEKTPTAVIPLGARQVGEVTCVIDNPDHDLLPGTNVNAEIRSKVAENVLTIPKSAVRRDNGQPGVFVLDGDRVRWRPVTLGVASVARTEVSGLKQGDSVALPSDRPLKNGMLVTAVYP